MLSDRHKRFLIVDQGVVPTIFNFLLNGLICWALFRTAESVSLWGESSVGVDLLVTAFVLPFLTTLIVSAIVLRELRAGKLPPLLSDQLPLSGWFKRSSFVRGLLLGICGVVLSSLLSRLFGRLTLVKLNPLLYLLLSYSKRSGQVC